MSSFPGGRRRVHCRWTASGDAVRDRVHIDILHSVVESRMRLPYRRPEMVTSRVKSLRHKRVVNVLSRASVMLLNNDNLEFNERFLQVYSLRMRSYGPALRVQKIRLRGAS